MSFSFTNGYENYAKFPMHYMRVTQSWNKGNHKPHWDGANYKDYPIDLGGMDSGRDYLYAPVDMKIVALNGIGSKTVSNKIFLESVEKVQTVKHGKTKIFMTAVHFNDSDVSKFGLKVGKVIKAGQAICFEGTETATANHLHFTCGVGSAKASIENNKGKWVTKGDCKKPEEIFYVDPKFTKVLDKGGLFWSELPKKPVTKTVKAILGLVLRDKATTKGKKLLTIPYKKTVEIVTMNAGYSNGYNWSKVKYNGKTGYVASKYLK